MSIDHVRSQSCRIWTIIFAFGFTASLRADETPAKVSFVKEIAPILQAQCIACHHFGKTDGGLALDTVASLMAASDSGMSVVPGKSSESSLIQRLEEQDVDLRMPQKSGPLSPEQIAVIRRWIDEGATSDADPAFVIKPMKPSLPDVASEKQLLAVQISSISPPLESRITYGPAAPVTALGFSPDGKFLAVGAYQLVQLWDLQAGNLARVFNGHRDSVGALSFTSDGTTLIAAGGVPGEPGEIRIWDVASGQLKHDLTEHKDSIYAIAVSRDGKWMASGGADGIVNVWDLATVKIVQSIKEHGGWIYGLAFSADNQFLATACGDKTIRIFKVGDTWERQGKFDQSEPVWNVSFNADGSQLAAAVGGPSDKSVRIHNRSDGKLVRTLGGHNAPVMDVVWSDDGKLLASASADKSARLFDAANGAMKFTLANHPDIVFSTALSSDGRFVATGDADGIVRLWNTADGKPLATLISLSVHSADWMLLASTGYYNSSGQPTIEWRRGDQVLPSDQVHGLLMKPDLVQKSIRSEPVDAPVIP